MRNSYIVIGAGAFGSSTALELAISGHAVTVLERSADGYHSPDAASNDVNKIIRADYSDEHYRDLAKATISTWRRDPLFSPFYHETGLMLWSGEDTSSSLLQKNYIRDGVSRATARAPDGPMLELPRSGEELPPAAYAVSSKEDLIKSFPTSLQPKMDHLVKRVEQETMQAYFNPRAGWAEADRATRRVLDEAKRLGVIVHGKSPVVELLFDDNHSPSRVIGVITSSGQEYHVEGNGQVILCAGAWASTFMQNLIPKQLQLHQATTWPSGQCVVVLQLNEEQTRIQAGAPVTVDFTNGFYTFEPDSKGIMKIAIHDKGFQNPKPSTSTSTPISYPSFASGEQSSSSSSSSSSKCEQDQVSLSMPVSSQAKQFIPKDKLSSMLYQLKVVYPHLDNVQVLSTRICFYSESDDENWIIDHFPGLEGLVVASGDSGHGFKFLPIIGQLICARLGLPSVDPLTAHQKNVFSFKHHQNQQAAHQVEAERHRAFL